MPMNSTTGYSQSSVKGTRCERDLWEPGNFEGEGVRWGWSRTNADPNRGLLRHSRGRRGGSVVDLPISSYDRRWGA